jgi:hypothetical protein
MKQYESNVCKTRLVYVDLRINIDESILNNIVLFKVPRLKNEVNMTCFVRVCVF